MIPRRLIQLWIGDAEIPERERAWCAAMKAMNSDWTYFFADNNVLTEYRQRDAYLRAMIDRKEPWAFVSDRLRVLILRDKGGLYVDADSQPLRPFADLDSVWNAPHVEFVTGHRNALKAGVALSRGISLVDDTFMATVAGGRLIERLTASWTHKTPVLNGNLIGKVIMNESGPEVAWLNYRTFYSDAPHPDALVLHDPHNIGSWVDKAKERPTPSIITA